MRTEKRGINASNGLANLSVKNAQRGASKCLQTAQRLIRSASVLSKSGFLELATFAVCTALEETGKALLLMEYQEALFAGRDGAGKELAASFFTHPDKLEQALVAWKRDEVFFEGLQHSNPNAKSAEVLADKLRQILGTMAIPKMKPRARQTFKMRNRMLYTDFKRGRFHSPRDSAGLSTLNELLDIAEKAIARAELDWAMGQFVFRRGGSRTQLAQIVLEKLPEIIAELKGKMASGDLPNT